MAKNMEEIAVLLQNTKFKKCLFGGISPADLWLKLERLQKEYEEVVHEEQQKQKILLEERDRKIPLTPQEVIAQSRRKAESGGEVRALFGKAVLMVVLAVVAFQLVWGIGVVEENDMGPALKDGDLAFFYRLDREFVLTDVVCYEKDGMHYYGRIAAVEGDSVDMSEAGELLINGDIVEEEIFYPTQKENAVLTFPYTVEEGEYFVLGDYRVAAMDSRRLGAIKADDIEGKLIGFFRRRGI